MKFFQRFSGFQWKLAFSYVLVTLLTLLVVQGIFILFSAWFDFQFSAMWDSQSFTENGSPMPGRLLEGWLTTALILLPCVLPLGLIFGFVTSASFTRRLRNFATVSRALAEGDLDRRVQDSSGDELGELGRQFNSMADQLQTDTLQLHELADRNAELAQETQKLAALEERHRLARELHDGVKQHLFGVNLSMAAAFNLLDNHNAEEVREKLTEAKEYGRLAQAEMVALLGELRPAGLDERGLVTALANHLVSFESREGIKVVWEADPELDLPLTHQQALFRVAQEALNNAARHAQASQVTVNLNAVDDQVVLHISDDGKGFTPANVENEATMGIQGMQERIVRLGGIFQVDSTEGVGTRIEAHLPYSTREHEGKTNE